jgi:hypothetical protein
MQLLNRNRTVENRVAPERYNPLGRPRKIGWISGHRRVMGSGQLEHVYSLFSHRTPGRPRASPQYRR